MKTTVCPAAQAVAWLRRNEPSIVLNPIVLGELECGILLLPVGRRRKRLQNWIENVVRTLRVMDLGGETARIWARIVAELKHKGRAMPVKHSLIAATARQHSLTVATRNTSDYQHAGVKLVNPD